MSHIRLRGARERNLQDVDLDVPLGQWTAVVGPSGSGKSTLVFDTLVREGQRRFLSHLSVRARRALSKLGHADVDYLEPMPATIAIGAGTSRANARSTVGTLTGVLDRLRLLYARTAVSDHPLTRAHFSFNNPVGQCAACRGLGVQDIVDPALLIADASKSIRDGALVPTLKNGYTVYSQVTVDVMDTLCQAHGFTIDTPWTELTEDQQHMALYGTDRITVPFGKHSIESRMKWEGITARPREEGHYRGLVPVIEETLKRSRNPNILRFVRSIPCRSCDGTRLGPVGRTIRLGTLTLPQLLARPVHAIDLDDLPQSDVLDVLRPSLDARLGFLIQLGLGHLSLDRPSTSLSGGEAQRVRLMAQVGAGLSGVLYALDEPTLGLHPNEQHGLSSLLNTLLDSGNTVVTVEHDPDMVRHADHLVVMGPGAGPHGGQVISAGPMPPHPLGTAPDARQPREWADAIRLTGATLHNLDSVDIDVPIGCMTVVRGPSGAGKTSLILSTLVPALTAKTGGSYTALTGVPDHLTVDVVDASPIGRTPRSTPATWTGLFDRIRKRFAKASGRKSGDFSYNTKSGRCPHCDGLGTERITLHLLANAHTICPVCDGSRYAPHALDVRVWKRTIAEVLQLTVTEAVQVFADEPELLPTVRALSDLGMGYVQLGQDATTLSRGEAQRVKLSVLLASAATAAPRLVVFDEPDRGLHPTEVTRLLTCLDRLLDVGHTVLAISHHRHVWAAADQLITLDNGRRTQEPYSSEPLSTMQPARTPSPPKAITLSGVRTHGLDLGDIAIPHGQITAVTGPSGSGKSTLVFDTLAAVAWHRYAESLPFAARSAVRRLPKPKLDGATGLQPTLALRQLPPSPQARSTVATLTGLGPLLRLLWSRLGTTDGEPTALSMGHFSPDQALGACPTCSGRGTVGQCDPDRLIQHPDKPLFDGAMTGTRPGRFFGEPDGQYAATLRAAAPDVHWSAPWSALPPAAHDIALHGTGDAVFTVTWSFKRGKRTGEHTFTGPWVGLCALVEAEAANRANARAAAEWAEPLAQVTCTACDGARLNAVARAVTVNGHALADVLSLPAHRLPHALGDGPQTLMTTVRELCEDLVSLGVGHLSLDRTSATLSGGELQRVRMAGVLRSGLTGTTLVLDEPDVGLHDDDIATLNQRLVALRDAGNTVVVVTHRAATAAIADHTLVLGTAVHTEPAPRNPQPLGPIHIRAAHKHTLADLDVDLPASGVVAVTGVSGAGKTTLVFDVLGASAQAGHAVGCAQATGLDRFNDVIRVRSAAKTPLAALGLLASLQKLFAAQDGSLPRAAFSFNSPKGRCPTCKGTGQERVTLDGFGDLSHPCPTCDGSRYRAEVLDITWNGLTIADVLTTPVRDLPDIGRGPLADGISAMRRTGLGHLSLGRRAGTLSGGEAQRLALAAALTTRASAPRLFLFDEPGAGLHDSDLIPLAHVFRQLADEGNLVVLTAHRRPLIASADHIIALRPPPR